MLHRPSIGVLFCCLAVVGCGGPKEPLRIVEYYKIPHRQLPPEPVYNRLAWSHLPQPMPAEIHEQAPYLSPTIRFEMPDSTVEEAVEALAQTIGYRWNAAPGLGSRKVSVKVTGRVDEIINEIDKQGNVLIELDHDQRTLRVTDQGIDPRLLE